MVNEELRDEILAASLGRYSVMRKIFIKHGWIDDVPDTGRPETGQTQTAEGVYTTETGQKDLPIEAEEPEQN